MKDSDNTVELFIDCMEVLNHITNRTYWSKQEGKEYKSYTLASNIGKGIEYVRNLISPILIQVWEAIKLMV